MNNNKRTFKCSICLDVKTHLGRNAVDCAHHHSTCRQCFKNYVIAMCGSSGWLKDHSFVISCPVHDCNAAWTFPQLRSVADCCAQDAYVNGLIKYCKVSSHKETLTTSCDALYNTVLECLNFKCPSCQVVLDPTPDGCAAIRCLKCATYFCWMCFEISATSTVAHRHVTLCKFNTLGLVFPSSSNVLAAHKQYKLRNIQHTLESHVKNTSARKKNDVGYGMTRR